MDFLCGAGLCLFVRLCDVLVQEVVVCCWLEFVEVCRFVSGGNQFGFVIDAFGVVFKFVQKWIVELLEFR